MPTTETQTGKRANPETLWDYWIRLSHSLGAKLILALLSALVVIFALLGYLSLRLHRTHLEASTLRSAERLSDMIKRSASYSMMRNDRDALREMIETAGKEPGIVRIRIIDKQGTVTYTTDPHELDRQIDPANEACTGCHADSETRAELKGMQRFRIFKSPEGRVLGIITPIENQPSCSNAACHAHPASQKILGVLDTNLSLAMPTPMRESTCRMLLYTMALCSPFSATLSSLFIRRLVQRPVNALMEGTKHLSEASWDTRSRSTRRMNSAIWPTPSTR